MEVTEIILPAARIRITRVVFGFVFLCLAYAFFSHALLHQLRAPVMRYPYLDPFYWAMHLLKIPDFVTGNHAIALTVDLMLLGGCVGTIFFPGQRLSVYIFFFSFVIYFVCYNSYGAHHTHSLVGILLIPVPFLFRNDTTFTVLWQGLRYYMLYIFVSAFVWKLVRISFMQEDHGLLILENNLTPYLFYHPTTLLAGFYSWLLAHPFWVNAGYIAGIIAEGFFITGFFTRKFDRVLFFLSLVLILGFWLMADALFFQLLVLNFTLVDFNARRIIKLHPPFAKMTA